ncbi:MAG: DEAD/DEAH box helicase [Anaerolineales bacterium]|nr:DEAD/DEAH box helicase [Anaerolineales bacterium]
MSFTSFDFHADVVAGVRALGYHAPTPIQKQAIPPVLAGRDVIGLAQTGTGKTAAFVLPILQRLRQGPRGRVRALIIAPTRELAEQIHTTIGDLGRQTRLRSVTLYGGVGITPQISRLRAGVEIVVACPGRLLDHLGQGTVRLNNLEVLVLDEADRMLDMGFLPDVRRILKHVPAQRQTLLFSATMPDDVGRLAREVLREPVTVQAGHTRPLETIAHALYPVGAHLKTPLLLALLARTSTGSVLVFTRTKHRAKRLAQQLQRAGFPATSLQGNLSQNQRQASMEGFRSGKFQIMVATDIAARGLDIALISHVINYDVPDTVDAYTHRIGRTGRAARTGDAFTLVTPEDGEMVRSIERRLGGRLERRALDGFDYQAQAPEGMDFSRARALNGQGQRRARPPAEQATANDRSRASRPTSPKVAPAADRAQTAPGGARRRGRGRSRARA